LDQDKVVAEDVLRRRWDMPGSALLGAGFGVLVQSSHEFHHNFIASSGVRDPIAAPLLALPFVALVGALLFTVITVAHNFTVRRRGGKKPAMRVDYQRGDFAGAILGILLVLAHEAFNFLSGRWQIDFLASADPFSHIVWELVIAALGGELWFRAVAKIRGWNAA
jgi:hypothetical protein